MSDVLILTAWVLAEGLLGVILFVFVNFRMEEHSLESIGYMVKYKVHLFELGVHSTWFEDTEYLAFRAQSA